MHKQSLFRCIVTIGEGSSKLDVISRGLSLSLFDMLLATKGGSGTFVKFSFPVMCLMHYSAETGLFSPPNRLTLQITLVACWQQ
jgi:hypothetical protein